MPRFDLILDPATSTETCFIRIEAGTPEEAVEAARSHLAAHADIKVVLVELDGVHVRTVRRD